MEKPRHIAIIMDGNRRWAKKHGLSPDEGHKAGTEALKKVVKEAAGLGLAHLTVYALSTENLKNRAKEELDSLFALIKSGFVEKLPILKKEGVKVTFFGDLEGLPIPVRRILSETEKNLREGKRLQLNIALNYGGRAEIVEAAKKVGQEKEVTAEGFEKFLSTGEIPAPDLIIRTGGEQRLSNFLLWQAAYSELYFTDELWPDFDKESFQKALSEYSRRKRNFGA